MNKILAFGAVLLLTPFSLFGASAPAGSLDVVSCDTIAGWAYDPDTPSEGIPVHIYYDGPAGSGTFLTDAWPNTPRADVNATLGISGVHGFSINTPTVLRDGKTHAIYVHAIDSAPSHSNNPVIANSPQKLVCDNPNVTPIPISAPGAPSIPPTVDIPPSLPPSIPLPIPQVPPQNLDFNPGIGMLAHPETLPLWLPNGTQTKQVATYETSGGNEYWGFEKSQRYTDENGEWVIFDEYGPGVLSRMQMNAWDLGTNGYYKYRNTRIKFYFDNETQPRLDQNFDKFFGSDQNFTSPTEPPLTFFDNLVGWGDHNHRFSINYYPFPFSKRLKVTVTPMSEPGPKWYQFTFLKFPTSVSLSSWTRGSQAGDTAVVRRQWNSLGQDPKNLSGNITATTTLAIPVGASATIFDTTGQGSISSIVLSAAPYNRDIFTKAKIQIYWDNSNTPAVDMSLGSFFGGAGDLIGAEDVSYKKLTNLLYGYDGANPNSGSFYSYWPMPYWSRARIVIVNESGTDISAFSARVNYKPSSIINYSRDRAGHFYARRTTSISSSPRPFSLALSEQGRGKVVGLMFYTENYSMDGDEFTYIDDSSTPQIHGDGTEDDHNQGWGGDAYQKALWGGLVNGYQGGYRTYLSDPYIFNKNIRVTYEHSNHGGITSGQRTDAVVYYYKDSTGQGNLSLSDQLDVGNARSEAAHAYTVNGETWMGTTDSNYDGYEQKLDFKSAVDTGRAYKGSSQFTVSISPSNTGVKLRKRTSRVESNVQTAEVYVDGSRIESPWYIFDLPADEKQAFIDSDFEIPSSYTAGKNRITIQIKYLDSSDKTLGIKDYYYWVYSYGGSHSDLSTLPANSQTATSFASLGSFVREMRDGSIEAWVNILQKLRLLVGFK